MFQQVVSFVAGTAVLRQYDIGEQVASAGLWKIYGGTKKTTGQKVAVFMFEKKFIDNTLRKGYEKKENEKVYQVLKREASQLSRLRHPSLLEVVEAVEESRTVITFATEPIVASLSNLLNNYDNLSPVPDDIKNFEMDELEIQKGLLQVGKGLQFCHNDAKIVHSNLVPEAIFVNVKGDWKIGGFGFSNFIHPDSPIPYDYPDYDARIPFYAQKSYDYMAPEYVLDESLEIANDMFALGSLIYTIHSNGKPPMENRNSIHNYRKNVENLSKIKYDHLPYHLHEVMFNLLTRYPSQRMTASEFQTSKYFDNVLVSTVKFFESFPEKSKDDKANFMKGLIRILPQFPERVLMRKILPCLLQEIKDHSLLPYTLPNIFYIAQKLPNNDFCSRVLDPLKPIFSITEPMQNMISCLDKIELFQQKTSSTIFKEDVMPLIYNALEAKTLPIQEKVLKVMPTIIENLDLLTIKSSLFPRIQNLFTHTTILSIKITTLICLQSLVKSLDNFTITEKLIPLLKGIKTKEPNVMISALSVYDEMGKNVEKDVIATEVLPQLWKMSVVPTLNFAQFQKFMKAIKFMSLKVEEQHSKQLQDIKSMEDNTQKHLEGGSEKNKDELNSSVDFEKLVGVSKESSIYANNHINGKKDESIDINDPFEIPSDNNNNNNNNFSSTTFINSLGKSNIVSSHHNSSGSNRSFSGSHITIQPDFFDSASISPPPTPQRNSINNNMNNNNYNNNNYNNNLNNNLNNNFNNNLNNNYNNNNYNNNNNDNDNYRTHYTSIQSFSSGAPSLSSQTITNISNGHSSFNNFHSSPLPQSNNQTIQTIQATPINAIQNIPPLSPPQNHNQFIDTSSSSRTTSLTQVPMGNLNNLYNSALSSASTTLSTSTSFTNPQNSLNLNLGNILKPNISPSDDNNNKSTSHKKQADLTMFDPFS
ncbi:hypothetical protein Glove_137g49 [Diversispora epigaea]|uniref:Protein kinase domain-containing protein n=1 Tax=Diversispora epigaea TaxID=1348612 RepID=A0A397J2U2_9GLOM|nr:hypothetical protein Glove_137g49 [Diversispora epigaea]